MKHEFRKLFFKTFVGVSKTFAYLFFLIFSPKFFRFLKLFFNICYSKIISKSFNKVGSNFQLEYPAFIYGGKNCVIGNNFKSNKDLRIEIFQEFNGNKFNPHLYIGNKVSFNFRCHLGCINRIEIHDGCLFGSNILITDHNHGRTSLDDLNMIPVDRTLNSTGPVIIHKNVWVGENVSILPNTEIGQGSIIGANSVVKGFFPPYSIIAGIPGRIIKKLDG